MPKNILTMLGCSGSLSLTLLTGYAAQANTVEYVFTAPIANPEEVVEAIDENTDCSCQNSGFSDDPEGELAINQFGCDCAGCRNLARSMRQQDTFGQ